MGKMPTSSLGKSSELKLHCFCLFDAYSMPKDMCSVSLYKSGLGHFPTKRSSDSKIFDQKKPCQISIN